MVFRKSKKTENSEVDVMENENNTLEPVEVFPKKICPRCDSPDLFVNDEVVICKEVIKNVTECSKCGTYQYTLPNKQVTVWRFKIDDFGGMISPDNLDARHLYKDKNNGNNN